MFSWGNWVFLWLCVRVGQQHGESHCSVGSLVRSLVRCLEDLGQQHGESPRSLGSLVWSLVPCLANRGLRHSESPCPLGSGATAALLVSRVAPSCGAYRVRLRQADSPFQIPTLPHSTTASHLPSRFAPSLRSVAHPSRWLAHGGANVSRHSRQRCGRGGRSQSPTVGDCVGRMRGKTIAARCGAVRVQCLWELRGAVGRRGSGAVRGRRRGDTTVTHHRCRNSIHPLPNLTQYPTNPHGEGGSPS